VNKKAGTSVCVQIPADLTIKLRRLAEEQHVSLHAILLCAWVSLLNRGLGEADVVIGIETSCRSRLVQAPVIGPFTDLVPIRIHVDEATTIETLLRKFNRAIRLPGRSDPEPWRKVFEVRGHGGRPKAVIPLAVCACPPLNLGDLASFDVPGLTMERVWVDQHWPCAKVSFCLEERGMNLMITLRGANDVAELGTVQNIAGRLLNLLDALGTNRRGFIFKLPLMNN
jgi:hypothetical protein